MRIDKDLISNLEKLARLQLSEAEKEILSNDLERILGMAEKLKELNTDHVEPLIQISEEWNVFREDEVKQIITREEALKNAPDKNDQFIKVPNMINSKK